MKLGEKISITALLCMMLMILMLDSDLFWIALVLTIAFGLIAVAARMISESHEPFVKPDGDDKIQWNREQVWENWLNNSEIK